MPMPNAVDYETRIRNWRQCLDDPELLAGEPFYTPRGPLWQVPGGFATVFRFLLQDGDHCAVRCFTKEMPNIQARYEAISAHLAAHPTPFMVDFVFIAEGILVGEDWYPIVKMRWAAGEPLDTWLEDALDRRDLAALGNLEERWLELLAELVDHGIAHGDLHPSNILVSSDGDPVLVDYDGLYVPALAGQPSNVAGLPNFIHPVRARPDTPPASWYGPDMDGFSGWVILITLRALRRKPELWDDYECDERRLLFDDEDLGAPDETDIWHDLRAIDDAELQVWLDRLAEGCARPPAETPALPLEGGHRLRSRYLRAVASGDEMTMIVAWELGARDLPELQSHAPAMAELAARRVAEPEADPWRLFTHAWNRGERIRVLSLWPSVEALPEAASYREYIARLAGQVRQRRPPPPPEAMAHLQAALDAHDELRALMIWETVKGRPSARVYDSRIAQLQRRHSPQRPGGGPG